MLKKIYDADTYNNRIVVATQQADGSFLEWRTLAGSGFVGSQDGNRTTASFKQPHGLSVAAGFVFVADTFN